MFGIDCVSTRFSLREAAMRLRLICGCYCSQFLRQLPKFIILCTTSCRSSIEGLTTKFHSLEHSHEGLILYTASFHCQYRGLSIEYQCAWHPQRFVTVILFREIRMRIGSKYSRRRKVWSWREWTLAFQLSTRFRACPLSKMKVSGVDITHSKQ